MLSWLAFSVAVMLAARMLIAVLALAWGGMWTPTRITEKLAWRVEGSASDSVSGSGEQKVERTSESLHHLSLTKKLIPPPLNLFDRSSDLSARKSV